MELLSIWLLSDVVKHLVSLLFTYKCIQCCPDSVILCYSLYHYGIKAERTTMPILLLYHVRDRLSRLAECQQFQNSSDLYFLLMTNEHHVCLWLQEFEMRKQEREEAQRLYKKKKMEAFKILSKKTKKGQPNLNLQMEYLLQKIQENS